MGKGEFCLVFAAENSGLNATGQQASDSQGVALTFIHTHEKFLTDDGINKFSLQIGNGAAKTFTSGYETAATTNGTYIIPDEPGSWRFRATESFIAQPWENISISPALVYQYTDYNNFQGNRQWISAGVRPIYHFNKFFSLAFEPGVDHVDDSGIHQSGTLCKLSLAPQVSLGNQFLSRPVIRAYVTYATWTKSFEGEVGGNDYANETSGWTLGYADGNVVVISAEKKARQSECDLPPGTISISVTDEESNAGFTMFLVQHREMDCVKPFSISAVTFHEFAFASHADGFKQLATSNVRAANLGNNAV